MCFQLLQIKDLAENAHYNAKEAFELAETAKNQSEKLVKGPEDIEKRMNEFLNEQHTTPAEVRDLANKILSINITDKGQAIQNIVNEIKNIVASVDSYSTEKILQETAEDLDLAKELEKRANATLQQAMEKEERVDKVLALLEEIEKYCKNLTKIMLIDYSLEKNIFTDEVIQSLFKKNSKLSRIHLECINIKGSCLYMLQPSQIEEFTIICSNIKSKNLCPFINQLINLKIFNYSVSQYNNELIIKIVETLNKGNCRNVLEFTAVSKGKIFGLSEFICKQKKIRQLELRGAIEVEENFWMIYQISKTLKFYK